MIQALNNMGNKTRLDPGQELKIPVAASDPEFGCQFTSEYRDYSFIDPVFVLPPCP